MLLAKPSYVGRGGKNRQTGGDMKFARIITGAAVVGAIVSAASAAAQDQYGRDRYNRYNWQ